MDTSKRSPKEKEYRDEQQEIEYRAKKVGEMLADSYKKYTEVSEGYTPGKQELGDMIKSHIEFAVSRYHHVRAEEELKEYLVLWDIITSIQVTAFYQALKDAKREEDIQKFLTQNKIFLVQHLGGGHGRYVIPKPELGSQLVPDFLVAEVSSIGIEWYGIELESPNALMFTRSGQASYRLTQSIQQIVEWREWLTENIAYARNQKPNGLGLIGIDANLPATILMGKRDKEIPANFNAYRKQTKRGLSIEIHSYDWLLEQCEHRVRMLEE